MVKKLNEKEKVLGRDTVEFEGRRGDRRKKSSTISSMLPVGFSRINFERRMPKADGSTEDSPQNRSKKGRVRSYMVVISQAVSRGG